MRNEFDRIVIGGGAAGLFAAGWAAKSGLRVLVLEKRERPARKILVTGKGRCNVTNHCSPQEFIAAVRRNPPLFDECRLCHDPAGRHGLL